MKKLKKLMAVLLAVMLVLAVQVPVSAYAPSKPRVTYCGYSGNGKLRVQWTTQSDADGYLIKYYDLCKRVFRSLLYNKQRWKQGKPCTGKCIFL